MANAVFLSALVGLFTFNVAANGKGHEAGGSPPSAVEGSQGQLCCGENAIVMVQLCCGLRLNAAPGELAQLSCSVKFGKPVKSLAPNGLVSPGAGLISVRDKVKPVRGVVVRLLLVRVMVCVVAPNPTC